MINLLSATFFENFGEKMMALFQIYNFWIGVFLAVLGVTMFLLARRLTRVHRGQDEIVNNDKVFLTYKILAVACVVFAVITWLFFC